MEAIAFTLIPVAAVLIGSLIAVARRPSDAFVSAMQHLAAGVVFGAAAAEILPEVMHEGSPAATLIGGAIGIMVMLLLKSLEQRSKGPVAMLGAVGIDIFIDGLVLGLAFVAGAKAGLLLTIALTLEVLFLGLTLVTELGESVRSKKRIIAIAAGIALMLPLGAAIATPVALLPPVYIAGFLSFGLMALLYLVTEELLVEAHEKPDTPLISSMFFIGFLGLLLIEEMLWTGAAAVAVRVRGEYSRQVRALFHLLFILSVAMLPLTSFAARAGTAADLTSSAAVEVEQAPLPSSGPRAPVQVHRHCTHWAAEAGTCLAIAQSMSTQFPIHHFGPDAFGSKMAGPEASTPPPKA